MCDTFDIACHVRQGAQDALNLILKGFVDAISDALGKAMAACGTVWISVQSIDLKKAGGGAQLNDTAPGLDKVSVILGYLSWIGAATAVGSLIVLGALIAVKMRAGEGVLAVGRAGVILLGVVLIAGASSLVGGIISSRPTGAEGTVSFIQSSLWWYTAALAIASVIIGGIRMIWEQRAAPGKEIIKSVATFIVISGAGLAVLDLLVKAGDSFSTWIINQSINCDIAADGECLGRSLASLIVLSQGQAFFLMIILGLLALLASLLQMILMIARGGMLVVLAGILPLSASFSNTEMGKNWLTKNISWLIALALYKPAAAVIYAAAFKLVASNPFGQDKEGIIPILSGFSLMVLALIALPALMKFTAPMVGAMTGGGGGGGAAAAGGAGAAMLVKNLPTGAGSGSSSASTPSSTGSSSGSGDGPSGNDGSGSNTSNSTTQSSTASSGSSGTAAAGGGSSAAAGAGSSAAAGSGSSAAVGAAAAGAGAATAGVGTAVILAAAKATEAAQSAAENVAEATTTEGNEPSGSSN